RKRFEGQSELGSAFELRTPVEGRPHAVVPGVASARTETLRRPVRAWFGVRAPYAGRGPTARRRTGGREREDGNAPKASPSLVRRSCPERRTRAARSPSYRGSRPRGRKRSEGQSELGSAFELRTPVEGRPHAVVPGVASARTETLRRPVRAWFGVRAPWADGEARRASRSNECFERRSPSASLGGACAARSHLVVRVAVGDGGVFSEGETLCCYGEDACWRASDNEIPLGSRDGERRAPLDASFECVRGVRWCSVVGCRVRR